MELPGYDTSTELTKKDSGFNAIESDMACT